MKKLSFLLLFFAIFYIIFTGCGETNLISTDLFYVGDGTTIPLDIPINLQLDIVTENSVTFYWDIVDNASSYEVYQSTTSGGAYTIKVIENITFNGTSATITGLEANTTYHFKVKAIGSGNYSDSKLSTEYISATTGKTPLDTPTGLILVEVKANSVDFSWDSIDNAIRYEVYQSDTYNGDYTKITDNIDITETNCLITGLDADTTYYFKVKAIGSGVYSDSLLSSEYIEATTGKIPLDTPTGLMLVKVTADSVDFLWNSVPDTNNYEVYQFNTSDETYDKIDNIKIIGTNCSITGLDADTTYYFKVKAIGDGVLILNSALSEFIVPKYKQ